MLTEAEKEWLKRREETLQELGSYYCPHCEYYKEEWDAWTGHCQKVHCRKLEERDISRSVLWDALKFEAKLNELRSKSEEIDLPCSHLPKNLACPYPKKLTEKGDDISSHCPYTKKWDTPCEWCNLKDMRLLVEKEMEVEDAGQ